MENVRLNLRQRKGRGLCNLGYCVSVFLDMDYIKDGKERSQSLLSKRLYHSGDYETRDEASKKINGIIAEYLSSKGYDVTPFTTRGNIDLNIDIQDDLIIYLKEFNEKHPFSFTMTDIKPIIIRSEEKHVNLHYIAYTEKDVMRICKSILKTRFEDGWYTWMKNYTPGKLIALKPTYTLEEINALPFSMEELKFQMIDKLSEWEKAEQERDNIRRKYKEISQIVKSKEVNTDAYEILREVGSGEYGFLETIEPDEIDG